MCETSRAHSNATRRLDTERLDMLMKSTPRVCAAVGAPAISGKSSAWGAQEAEYSPCCRRRREGRERRARARVCVAYVWRLAGNVHRPAAAAEPEPPPVAAAVARGAAIVMFSDNADFFS